MGASQSRGRQEREITINHPRFKNSKAINSGNTALMETDILAQQRAYERWKTLIAENKVKAEKYRFLLLPLRDSNYDKFEVCTNRRTITVTYDRYPFLLTDAIESKKAKKSAFEESELWQLLYAICVAEEQYSTIGGSRAQIGNICPQNIFISQKGKIRVANPYSWPQEPRGSQPQSKYLPPEQIEDLRTGSRNFTKNAEGSQQFSVGMTALSAGILNENSDLYDYEKMTFDMSQAKRRMNFWLARQRYSQNLRITVAYLCNIRLSRRWNLPELWKWMSNYRARIGANQFDGSTVELPDRFKDEVEQLRNKLPYKPQKDQQSHQINQYYYGYQQSQVLKQRPSVLMGENDSKIVNGSSMISPRQARSPKKEQALNKQQLNGPKAQQINALIPNSQIDKNNHSQFLNATNDITVDNLNTKQGQIQLKQPESTGQRISQKKQVQPILSQTSQSRPFAKNEAGQLGSPKQRLGSPENKAQQYMPATSGVNRKKITFSYGNPQQTSIKPTTAKPTEASQIRTKQAVSNKEGHSDVRNKNTAIAQISEKDFLEMGEVTLRSPAIQAITLQNHKEALTKKQESNKQQNLRESNPAIQKLKNSRSQQAKGVINKEKVKEQSIINGTKKIQTSKSIPSNINVAAKRSPNSSETSKSPKYNKVISPAANEGTINEHIKKENEHTSKDMTILSKQESKQNQQLAERQQKNEDSLKVQQSKANERNLQTKDPEGDRKLEEVENRVIDFISNFQTTQDNQALSGQQKDKNANKFVDKHNQSAKSGSSNQSNKASYKLRDSKNAQTIGAKKVQKTNQQTKRIDKQSIASPGKTVDTKKTTGLTATVISSKKLKQAQRKEESQNVVLQKCEKVGECKNPNHRHGQDSNITYLKSGVQLPVNQQQQSTKIKVKSIKEIKPIKVVKVSPTEEGLQHSKIYIAQVSKFQSTIINQEVEIEAVPKAAEERKAETLEKVQQMKKVQIEITKVESQEVKAEQAMARRQPKADYNDDMISDLLGFGKSKRGKKQQAEAKSQERGQQKLTPGMPDIFIEEIYRTNMAIKSQSIEKQ